MTVAAAEGTFCPHCESQPYGSETDTAGGLVVLFQCGATRYWTGGELASGSPPVHRPVGCQGRLLPRFYLDWRWNKVKEVLQ